MQRLEGRLLFAASDLIDHLECPHLTHLDLEVASGRLALEPTRDDAADLVARKGQEHEDAYLDTLRREGHEVVSIKRPEPGLDALRRGVERTLEVMRAGPAYVYQAVLFDGARWHGYADFLKRVETPSALGSWSYEVVDTKLARRVKPYCLLQLCFYSELLAAAQGKPPARMHVRLGSGAGESFRVAEFEAYYRRVKHHFERLVGADGLGGTYPDPVAHCGVCRWSGHCDERREADDHLSLVARLSRSQTVRLNEVGIRTVAELAAAGPADKPGRIGDDAFAGLSLQAQLQVRGRETGADVYDLLEPDEDRGLARLPAPSPGDLFFDMEGDPFFEGGLEYLFGVAWIEDGTPRFKPFWGVDREAERRAFEGFVDFALERLRRDPDAHIYHYAPYEPSALKRLMGLHSTREDEVDHLLRAQKLVDLYAVVRQGLRISKPSYSLKKLESFYMEARDTAVTDGGDSIVDFERFLETRDSSLLDGIERYNQDDCRSTWLLRQWLLERRSEAERKFGVDIPFRPPAEVVEPDAEAAAELDELQSALVAGEPEGSPRGLLAELLDYHQREAKPAWWEWYRRLEADEEELIERDSEALGGLVEADVAREALPAPKRSIVYTLDYPAQEHRVGPGVFVDPATAQSVTVVAVDDGAGRVRISRSVDQSDEALPRALIPGGPYRTEAQRRALRRLAEDVARRGLDADGAYGALRGILRRDTPHTSARDPAGQLQGPSFDLARAKEVVTGLEGSHLFVQGPPGSGKTYNGARLALHLLGRGARVGVTATSHKAIHRFLEEMEELAPEEEVEFRGLKKGEGGARYQSKLDHPYIESSNAIDDFRDPEVGLVAGTAWLFARAELDRTLDYLFVDEAGQVSLADALAVGTSARNVVLLGDPLQLAHVSQAIHPPGAGASVLEHLLGEDATIPPDRGLFIGETRRMHPDVSRYISEVVYDGRLESVAGCERQRVDAPGALTGTGVRFVPVEHRGNTRSAPEEAEVIAARVDDLVGGEWTDADGRTRALEPSDIMVVAPYNAQVRCLRSRLPEPVQVGTVDKFQGQEAPVVFFSMATSSGEEVPRHFDFLFSRERLNVAVSRARALAVLVCSPDLLRTRCRTAGQMRLVNALCRLVEVAETG